MGAKYGLRVPVPIPGPGLNLVLRYPNRVKLRGKNVSEGRVVPGTSQGELELNRELHYNNIDYRREMRKICKLRY
jgi:hypothetical protein